MSFKYSYNTIVYSGEDYLSQVKRLNREAELATIIAKPDTVAMAQRQIPAA